jgi:hypothetical protein
MLPKDLNEERVLKRKVTTTHPAAQHFVQDNTESPNVSLKAVLMIEEDFRGRECRCSNTTAREMCFRSTVAKQPGNTKVTKNNVTVRVDKDVFLLYVSVYDIMGVNVFDSKKLRCGLEEVELLTRRSAYKFCHVESYCFHVK